MRGRCSRTKPSSHMTHRREAKHNTNCMTSCRRKIHLKSLKTHPQTHPLHRRTPPPHIRKQKSSWLWLEWRLTRAGEGREGNRNAGTRHQTRTLMAVSNSPTPTYISILEFHLKPPKNLKRQKIKILDSSGAWVGTGIRIVETPGHDKRKVI